MSKYNLEKHNESGLYSRAIMKFPTRGVISEGVEDILSCDLVDMNTRPSNGFKYILNCVDVASRKAFALPMKSKSIADIKYAFQNIFNLCKPNKIWSDQEPAFKSREMQQLFKDYKISMYHTYSPQKSSICERFNRTMKEHMIKSCPNLKNWDKFIPKFIIEYNSTVHSSIKMTPNEAFDKDKDVQKVNIDNYNEKRREPKKELSIGDTVRISTTKGILEKKVFTKNWTDEIFVIVEVHHTNPTTYKIADEKGEVLGGSFYKQELKEVN